MTLWDMNSETKIGELRGSSPYQQFGFALAVGKVKAAGIDREVNFLLSQGIALPNSLPMAVEQ